MQNYLQLLLCPVVSIIAIHFCMVSWTLTKLQCVQNWLLCLVTKSPRFTCSVPLLRFLHWLPVRFGILFKISLFTYEPLREKQPVYLHCMLAASLPFHSLRSNKGNSLLVARVKTHTGTRADHCCAPSRWNNLPLSVCSAISVVTFNKHLRTHISLTWPFPHRYCHSTWPVDGTELVLQFCCWTPIWLSHHWAWLWRGYWSYRNLIDWSNKINQNKHVNPIAAYSIV